MATVLLARDLEHNRDVAVKVLKAELAATTGKDRFLREIEIAAQLQHPHILPVYDSGEADGILYYVIPFVEGESLRDRLGHGPLPPPEARRIASRIALAEALEAAGDAEGTAWADEEFVRMWSHADPSLQPRVEAAKSAIERLTRARR
jgi:serine/threonine-protein kinase